MGFSHNSRWQLAAVALWLCLGIGPVCLAAQPLSEYQVKAAFLYNFAKFVDWPAEAFPRAGAPFTFCIVGEDPFQRAFEETVEGHTVGGRPLAIRRFKDVRDLEGCHIAFVGSANTKALQRQVSARRNLLLTVGEAELFLRWGGVINLVREGGKVRFEINPDAASQAGLKISSKLLALARVVRDLGDK